MSVFYLLKYAASRSRLSAKWHCFKKVDLIEVLQCFNPAPNPARLE